MFDEPPRRKKVRLANRDYTDGAYFVTICTLGRHPILGTISDGIVTLNTIGQIVEANWLELRDVPGMTVDEFVVMPNHIHGIIALERGFGLHLPTLIRQFKSRAVKGLIRAYKDAECQIWQRGYDEAVLIGPGQLAAVRKYIRDNPKNWDGDDYHPRRPDPD